MKTVTQYRVRLLRLLDDAPPKVQDELNFEVEIHALAVARKWLLSKQDDAAWAVNVTREVREVKAL